MALRNIRVNEDPILRKTSKPVTEVTDRIKELAADMLETMYEADGVGLAAVQVGVLKRVVTIDIGDGPHILINPEILETSGSQTGQEGCLSIPGKAGIVTRPNYAKVKAYDLDMKEFILEGEELMARAIIHEVSHLDGDLYIDHVEGQLFSTVSDEDEE